MLAVSAVISDAALQPDGLALDLDTLLFYFCEMGSSINSSDSTTGGTVSGAHCKRGWGHILLI